uniref:Uncharacterized protein n=1 Tax=Glossina austeni TaxID=7395 RepID=A0A1A9V8B4_GLOAU
MTRFTSRCQLLQIIIFSIYWFILFPIVWFVLHPQLFASNIFWSLLFAALLLAVYCLIYALIKCIAFKCGLDRASIENANDRATELKRIHNDIAITDNDDASLVAKIDTPSVNRDEMGEVEWGASLQRRYLQNTFEAITDFLNIMSLEQKINQSCYWTDFQ